MEDRLAACHGLSVLRRGLRGSRDLRGSRSRSLRGSAIFGVLFAVLLCLGVSACGSSGGRSTQSRTVAARPSSQSAVGASGGGGSTAPGSAAASLAGAPVSGVMPPGDQDGDSPDNKAFDRDDSFVTTFGHPASPSDSKAVTSLVKRYYTAIAKDDGATACKLLFFVIVESAPETYGQTQFDAAAGRGKSCGPVMSKVFRGNHRQLVVESRTFKVIGIRVLRKRAWVLLRFGPKSVRRLVVYREGNSWKVGELLDTGLV